MSMKIKMNKNYRQVLDLYFEHGQKRHFSITCRRLTTISGVGGHRGGTRIRLHFVFCVLCDN